MYNQLKDAKEKLFETHPLIHAITSPIAINDCANAILSLGAQPICAEHPSEVAGITRLAKALTVTLANITQSRLEALQLAGEEALKCGIPSLIDLVGITCSPMRMEAAEKFLRTAKPAVIKGNYTEIRAIAKGSFDSSSGVDVSENDVITSSEDGKLFEMLHIVQDLSIKANAVVMATGAIDLISDGSNAYAVMNGDSKMARITGTGCILTCITGAYLAVSSPLEACLNAILNWDLSGEIAAEIIRSKGGGLSSYHIELMDQLSLLTAEEIAAKAKVRKLN